MMKHLLATAAATLCAFAAAPALGDFKVVQNGQRSDTPQTKQQQPQFGQYRIMESIAPNTPTPSATTAPTVPTRVSAAELTTPVSLPVQQEISPTTARSDNLKLVAEVLRLQSESNRLQAEVERLRADLAALHEQLLAIQNDPKPNTRKITTVTQELDRIEQGIADVGTSILRVSFGSSSTRFTPPDDIGRQIISTGRKANRINISGHADNSGPVERNKIMAMARAVAAKKYMTDHGIPSSKITVASRGSSEPVADNSTEEGRAQNRRIEMEFRH